MDDSNDIDSILDEVDDVLEENAEDFVRGYVQQEGNGGTQYWALVERLTDIFGKDVIEELFIYVRDRVRKDDYNLTEGISLRFGNELASYLGKGHIEYSTLDEVLAAYAEQEFSGEQGLADASERTARLAVADRRYAEAQYNMAHIEDVDPARASQLLEEFGRLVRIGEGERIDWLTGIWTALAASIEYDWPLLHPAEHSMIELQLNDRSDDRSPNLDDKPARQPTTEVPVADQLQPGASAQVLGSSLEDSFIKLLRRLFVMDNDTEAKVIGRLRAQSAGSQFGHDIEFDAVDVFGNGIKCHVECKNYRNVIRLADIADKLLQTEFYWSNKQLDHWILISPHTDASNELSLMVQSWNSAQRYPFNIQLWTPELGIRDLFRTVPDVYEKIYATKPLEQLPPVLEDKLLEEWQLRITPIARVSDAWCRYLKNSSLHCFPDEDSAHFEEIYSNAISLQALTENGLPANISLETAVRNWLGTAEARSLLLLAEFGEGKSFFTYSLSRRLAEEFLKRPDEGWVSLRLPLRALRVHPNAEELLVSRLSEIGTDIAEWRQVIDSHQTIVILDGFDEMSTRLDPLTVSRNIRALAECLEKFGRSKILITSRTHFFENRRDQQRFLDHAGHPQVYRIAPISRARRVENLSAHARRVDAEEKLCQLKLLYDPIGLAAKPLFLQMIKETLPRLPDDHFDELVLYQQYTRQSLERKLHDLRDELSTVIDQELINNLHSILEDIAVSLHTSQLPYIDLKEFSASGRKGTLAEVLWKMSDASSATQPLSGDPEIQGKDARARVGIRSLLKPVRNVAGDSWPVDFFHRSMREYFVARALVRAIADNQQRASQLLSHVPLQPEILNFAVLLMRQPKDILDERRPEFPFENTLYSLARSAVLPMYTEKHLGGNAITLLYALTRQLPHTDWSGLALDYAYLAGADLQGMSFRGSSMRYANLDNTQLEEADFRGADLTGVQLEETAGVLDLVLDEDQNAIYGAYGDNTVRRWSLAPGGRATSHTVCQTSFLPQSLEVSPYGDLIVRGRRRLLILSKADSGEAWDVVSNFRVRPDILDISVQRGGIAVQREVRKLEFVLHLYEPQQRETQASLMVDCDGPCRFISANAAFVSTVDGRLALHSVTSDGSQVRRVFDVPHMSCIDAKMLDERESLVVLGHGSGDVSLWRVHSNESSVSVEEIWQTPAHVGAVTTVQLSDSFVVSGGVDRTMCLFTLGDQWQAGEPLRLHRTLSCEGMKIDGVKGERERQLLQALIEPPYTV